MTAIRTTGHDTTVKIQSLLSRIAHDMLAGMGAEAFAERARHELLATGETVRQRTVDAADQLTEQEALIARLARDGRSNPGRHRVAPSSLW